VQVKRKKTVAQIFFNKTHSPTTQTTIMSGQTVPIVQLVRFVLDKLEEITSIFSVRTVYKRLQAIIDGYFQQHVKKPVSNLCILIFSSIL
jgi:hypothetical protein